MVEEDTDLLDPIFQSGGVVNPQWKPRNGLKGSQKGKPDASSKKMEENVTTEKKTDSRTSVVFPLKPSDNIIDLDVGGSPKKPSLGIPLLPKTPRVSTESNELIEEFSVEINTVSPATSQAPIQTTKPPVHQNKHEGKETEPERGDPQIVTTVSREGDLVLGFDGKTYRLRRGRPGRMGAPGPDVSLSLCSL